MTACRHIFCAACIAKIQGEPRCPKCRAPIAVGSVGALSDLEHSLLVRNAQVRCPMYSGDQRSSPTGGGCEWTGDYTAARAHLETSCARHPRPCTQCNDDGAEFVA